MLTDSLRPYVTAGVVLSAASAIAIAPLSAPPPDVQVAAPQSHSASVELTAATDLLTPWIDTFNTASANATKISQFYFNAPGADVQQAIVNQVRYLGQLLNDPGSIGAVFTSIGNDAQKVFRAATLLGEFAKPELGRQIILSNDFGHAALVASVPMFLPADMDPTTKTAITQVLQFAASPLSGVLISLVGPVLSPGVAALNSVLAGDLLNLPANVVDGFLNGATLNLDALLPVINSGLPAGTSLDRLGIAFGGLLSPGAPISSVDGKFTGGAGGSLLSSIDLKLTSSPFGTPISFSAPGVPVGPIAAMASFSQIVAGALGWNGTGNPLTKLTFPKIDTAPAVTALNARTAATPEGPAELPSAPSAVATLTVPDADSGAQRLSSTGADTDTSGGAAVEGATAPQSEAGMTTAVRTAPKPASKISAAPKKLVAKIRESLRATPGKRGLNPTAPNSGSAEGNSASPSSDDSSVAPKASESKNTGDTGSESSNAA